jgi:signal transduction histidine kinase
MGFVKLWYIGNCYLPVFLYLTGILFKKNRLERTWRYILLFLPPTISYLTILTNEVNGGLFYRQFSLMNTEVILGPIFYFHSAISYLYLGLAIYHLMTFSTQTSGLFSRQSLIIMAATFIPITVNIIITLRLINLPVYYTSIAFSITVFLFFISIVKYRFLNLTPIAIQTVLDKMNDSIVVISDNHITYSNNPFLETFQFRTTKLDNLFELFNSHPHLQVLGNKLENKIKLLKENPRLDSFDQELFMNNDIHYFQIEITPLYTPNSNVLWGFLLFFKDTTQIRKANDIIHRNQTMLIEQQHLASLGQLIGGIAHNMRTPIMSISGGLEALRDLVHEYELSIGDNTVTENDHREIASEMIEWIQKTKPFCSYMSDIISTVKDQAVRLNDSSMSKFTVSELLKRIDLLMKHELKIGHCILLIDNRMPEDTELPGTMNNMIQIIGNIIVNAIEAYEDTQGRIELIVEECSSLPGNTRISIRDYGPGLPEHLRERVFKEMTTTKGKKGTGLGLYLSYLTIKGKFGGTMWFDTVTSQGTTFHISVPTIKTGTMTGGKYNEEKTG